jgi:HAD superfamily hydrolase (TIGR01549 family)
LLKGTIFDLGETLIHLTASWEQIREGRIRAIYRALQERGVALDFNDLTREYIALHDEESDYAARTLVEIEFEKSLVRLLERLGLERNRWPATPDLVKRSFEYELDSWTLFPGVHEMLQQVQDLGFKIGLLSNARSDWAIREIMHRMDLTKHFDTIVTSAAVGLRKPRPEPFKQILNLLDLQAGEAVMIGNSLEADIAGARPLGLRTIRTAFSDDADQTKVDPDITVYKVSEIVPAIKRIAASG